MQSRYNGTTYRATTTAGSLYNNGNNATVTFSTNAFGTRQVTVNTTNANYSTSNLSYTTDDVTVAFGSLTNVSGNYVTVPTTNVTVTVPAGYHITTMVFNYYNNYYYPQSVTVVSGGGSYSGNSPGTWTAANNTTRSVSLRLTKYNNYNTYLSSVVITVVED